MRKLIVVLMTFGFAAAAFADTYTWTGAAGDGLWTTKGNWDPEVSGGPVGSAADIVFPSGDWSIQRDYFSNNYYNSITLEGGHGTVTFVGEGYFQAASKTVPFVIPEGRSLCVDGPELQLRAAANVEGGLRLKSGKITATDGLSLGGKSFVSVEGGEFSGGTSTISLTNSARFVISGGRAAAKNWYVYGSDVSGETGGCLRLIGGVLAYDTNYAYPIVKDGGHFENLGGTIVWGQAGDSRYNRLASGSVDYAQGEAFKDFLPPVGGQLIIPTCTTHSDGALLFGEAGTYENVGGEIFVTNASEVAAGNIRMSKSVTLRGDATINANALKGGDGTKIDLDLSRLNLGKGGYRCVKNGGSFTVTYRDGVTLGAWGDWSDADVPGVSTIAEGPLAFDTKDCFDGETARNISLSTVGLDAATELSARGGGTVVLADATFKEEFRTLEVEADTTLELTGSAPQLKAMNLRLGANATLKVDLANGGYVDAAAIAEFGEGAKIVVTALPATLTGGQPLPIYFAPAGTDPSLAPIEFAENVLPAGWTLATVGNNRYLTDGKAVPYDGDSKKYWTGKGGDNLYTTTANWGGDGTEVPGNANEAYFYGAYNTDISITAAKSIRSFNFRAESGPYMFSGKKMTFAYPNKETGGSPSFLNESPFAEVIADEVACSTAFRCHSLAQGSLAAIGGSSSGKPLDFGGDVRIGGAWTVSYLRVSVATSTSKCRSRLTVMPNATLQVANQSADLDFDDKGAGSLAIAKDGVAVIGGTALAMSSDNKHYVDGTLTVNCPLVTSARQTFRGDGTLKLLGGVAASETGVVRVEGNLTLVPSNWVNAVTLSVKDNVTIAPETDWTFGEDGVLEIVNHSTLTLAAGGHKISLAKPIVTESTIALKGAGKYEIAAAGMKVRKVTCEDGAKIALADGFGSKDGFTDVLTVREPDDSIAFDEGLKIKMRYDPLTDETTYSAKRKAGIVLIVR